MFSNKKQVAAVVVLIGAMFAGLFYISLPYIDPGYSAKKAGEYLVSKGVVEGPVVENEDARRSYHADSAISLPSACLTIIEFNRHSHITKKLHNHESIGSIGFDFYNDNLFLESQIQGDSEICKKYWINVRVPSHLTKKIIQEFENYKE